jgi:uncharacterized membrane protein YgcG
VRTCRTRVGQAIRLSWPSSGAAGRGERGFAMLLVFLMAAMIAISLYMEIPRVAIQSQRAKEQLLIDRGEQYKRAIQLFVKVAKRYPSDLKELESFQNRRLLRHRWVDPMTGKDEWRLVHIQNGILTDSKINKQGQNQQQAKDTSTIGQFIGLQAGIGDQPNSQGGGAVTIRNRIRPSDGGVVNGPPGDPTAPGYNPSGTATATNNGLPPQSGVPGFPGQTSPNGQPGSPPQPGVLPLPGVTTPQPGNLPGTQLGTPGNLAGRAGATPTGASATSGGGFLGGGNSFVGSGGSFLGGSPSNTGSGAALTPVPGGTYPGQSGTYPGQTIPGQLPGQPGLAVSSQTGGVLQTQYSTAQGANGQPPGFPQPGATPGAPNNAAADLIRNILTTPRPGGIPQQAVGGQVIGGGIAGIASTSEGESVMSYNDHSNYAEWEFIFDPQKVKQIPNPNAQGLAGTPASQLGNTQGTSQPGQPVQPGQNSPLGSQSPFGAQSPFGTPPPAGGRQ